MADSAHKKILIVEDEKPISRVLKMKLEQRDYEVVVVRNGVEAVKEFEQSEFDAILLDLILPEQDGFDTLKQIRAQDEQIPVIVLSNLGQPEDRERVEEYGITDYYVKADISLHELVEKIVGLV